MQDFYSIHCLVGVFSLFLIVVVIPNVDISIQRSQTQLKPLELGFLLKAINQTHAGLAASSHHTPLDYIQRNRCFPLNIVSKSYCGNITSHFVRGSLGV